MSPENKGRAKFVVGLAIGIGAGFELGKVYVRSQERKRQAKKPNVPWKKAK